MPLNFSVARGGKVCSAFVGLRYQQDGAWVPLETCSEDTLAGRLPLCFPFSLLFSFSSWWTISWSWIIAGCISCGEEIYVCSFSTAFETSIYSRVESPVFCGRCETPFMGQWHVWVLFYTLVCFLIFLFILLFICLFIYFCEGAWLNISLIWKNFFRDRLNAFFFQLTVGTYSMWDYL